MPLARRFRAAGFVLRFNAEGAEEAFRGVLAPLRGFWETSRRAGDNAFVLNLLHIAQQPDCEQRAPAAAQRRTKASLFELLDDDLDELAAAAADADVADADDDAAEGAQQRQYAVGLHVDETVGIDSARLFLAHAVSARRGAQLDRLRFISLRSVFESVS